MAEHEPGVPRTSISPSWVWGPARFLRAPSFPFRNETAPNSARLQSPRPHVHGNVHTVGIRSLRARCDGRRNRFTVKLDELGIAQERARLEGPDERPDDDDRLLRLTHQPE